MSASSLVDLVGRASFVFAGTVTSLGESSLRVLPSRPGLAVVRFDRGFLTNPVLGTLKGRPITVQFAREGIGTGNLERGQRLIFFATGWVHGEEIAVTELARLPADAKTEQEIVRIVESLPERHLSERIAKAVLIVHGTVTQIARATEIPRTPSEHDPYWMRALIKVVKVIKGAANSRGSASKLASVDLLFPGSRDIAFRNAPRPSKGQTAVFLLHQGAGLLPTDALIAPDPADIQPPGELATIRRLLSGNGGALPPR